MKQQIMFMNWHPQTKVVRFSHAALGFPTKATMLKAIQNNWLFSWPGLTVSVVKIFFPDTTETPKGHMQQQRQGVRSAKPKNAKKDEEQDANAVNPCHYKLQEADRSVLQGMGHSGESLQRPNR